MLVAAVVLVLVAAVDGGGGGGGGSGGHEAKLVVDWLRDNTEVLVLLKHLTDLPAVASAWPQLKDSPPVVEDRRRLQALLATDDSAEEPVPSCPLRLLCFLLVGSLTCQRFGRFDAATTELPSTVAQVAQSDAACGAEGNATAAAPSWIDRYEEDMKWIRSQFIPLNYMFEKLQTMERDALQLRVSQ